MAPRRSTSSRSGSSGRIPVTFGGRILGSAILFVGMNGALGMICGIFHALDGSGFERLFGLRQFFPRFVAGVLDSRKCLRVSALSRAVFAHLSRIVPEFVQLRLEIALALRRTFIFQPSKVFAHRVSDSLAL